MAEYIKREKVLELINHWKKDSTVQNDGVDYEAGWNEALEQIECNVKEDIPSADVRPERHGHIVWKERHSGGFRKRKCLSDCGVFTPLCNRVARIDDRHTENRPYCSKCGKLLGDFLSYCGNCGAKMDGKDDNNDA